MILMRIGDRCHLEQIRTEGLLYMNTARFFIDLENRARQDRFEGSRRIVQPKDVGPVILRDNAKGTVITFEPAEIDGPVIMGSVRQNVFCLSSINKPTDLFPIDARNLEFGASCILFTNTLEFLRRLHVAVEATGFPGEARLVDYFDLYTHSGETGPFMKPAEYSYQGEYRIALQTGSKGSFKLYLGDLTDITTPILPSANIQKNFDFTEAKARAAGFRW